MPPKETGTKAIVPSRNTAASIELVRQELSKLNKIAETVYFTADKMILGCKITDETSIENLLIVDASVKKQAKAYDESLAEKVAKGFIRGAKPFAISGISAESIIKDVDLRLQILSQEERRKQLKEIADGYTELLDKDDKLALLDAQLQQFLGQ